MTEIAFHHGVSDRLQVACRLLRKAHAQRTRVVVLALPEMAQQLSLRLWGLQSTAFIPHCHSDAQPHVLQRSPIVLCSPPEPTPADFAVLLNLTSEVPQELERFSKLIEIVSTENEDRRSARQRWKHYSQHGHRMVQHDHAASTAAPSASA